MSRSFTRSLLSLLFAALAYLAPLAAAPLPWRLGQRLGAAVGALGWRLARRDRLRTLEHLGLAFPDLTERERRRLGRACFRHLGTSAFECLMAARRGWPALLPQIEVEGWEHLEAARHPGKPVILLSAHCGNWELLGATVAARGIPLAAVARELQDSALNRFVVGFRARFGARTILRGSPGAARELLRLLRGGGVLAILIDQDTKVEGVWVPFFGRPAFTPVGAAEMALRLDAQVVPGFAERLPDGRHRMRFEPALALSTDETAATALMTERIEAQVRRAPEQWVWMHRRWRHQPPEGQC